MTLITTPVIIFEVEKIERNKETIKKKFNRANIIIFFSSVSAVLTLKMIRNLLCTPPGQAN